MRLRDPVVAGFVEDDAGAVPVVDDCVAHELRALRPAPACCVAFGVARRQGLEQAQAIERLDVLFPWGDVHPADEGGVTGEDEAVREIGEPGWDGAAEGGPFVCCALGIAFEVEGAVVELKRAVGELGLAEAGAGLDGVDGVVVEE